MVGADTGDVDDFYEGEIMSLVQPHMLTSYNYNYECTDHNLFYFYCNKIISDGITASAQSSTVSKNTMGPSVVWISISTNPLS